MEMFPGRTAIYKGARADFKIFYKGARADFKIFYKGARAKSIQFG